MFHGVFGKFKINQKSLYYMCKYTLMINGITYFCLETILRELYAA